MMKEVKWVLFALVVMAAGCKSTENSLALLRGQEWELKSMTRDGAVVANPHQLPKLEFSDSTAMYGSAGCNRFFGSYTTEKNGVMTIRTGGATMMFCPDMEFEDGYLKALNEVNGYVVGGNELQLKDESGRLTLIYSAVDTVKKIGVANDGHGCNAAAGYTWSEVRQECIRIFAEGVKFAAADGQDTTLAAYVVFAADSLKAEVFIPGDGVHPVLDRRELAGEGYAWNQEDDDTYNVRRIDGRWVIERRAKVLYTGVE